MGHFAQAGETYSVGSIDGAQSVTATIFRWGDSVATGARTEHARY
jgi:hypothetical protein